MGEKVCPLLMVKADTLEDARCLEKACAWYHATWLGNDDDAIYDCSIPDLVDAINSLAIP
jgi:hypothetical protein